MRTACTYIKGDNMKSIKRISRIAIGFLLVILSVFSAFAETIYTLDGYSYTVTDNLSMTLKDWDTSIDSNLSLPDTLANRYFTNIGNWAFENRTDLTGLDFSQSQHLTRIGYETFIGCSGIANDLVLPESLYLLNDRCFSGCSAIPSLTIKGNVTVIPTESFYGCSSLKSVVLPTTVKNIQSWAFGDCTELEYVEIPQNVTSIAISAFMNDPNLTLGVWYGSYGYEYAVAQNIPYVLLDGVKLGDANGDGSVNINDVTTIQRYLAELETLEGIYLHAADVNQDGTVDIADATTIQMYLAEYDMEYPIGEVMTQ